MAQLMFRIANEDPTDIRTIRPDIPAALVSLFTTALAKSPDKRFQTGGQMAQAIRACMATLP